MSGTSLDGLDCCYVEFSPQGAGYRFRNLQTRAIPYLPEWKNKLRNAFYNSPAELEALDKEYGRFLGEAVNLFRKEHQLPEAIALVASHGHTVFHQPAKGITVQIGSGEVISQVTGLPVINNFRIRDVQLGGQGAPLVPVGDHYLFGQHAACLNLGGFSNISFVREGRRVAFDISPCNLPLNMLVGRFFGQEYDDRGRIAASGTLLPDLLEQLNGLDFYAAAGPKSLGFEWLQTVFMPVVDQWAGKAAPADVLRTVTEHIAIQIGKVLTAERLAGVLVTGGGAYHDFLLDRLRTLSKSEIVVPTREIIEFKEALIFAFLGYLNLRNQVNTFKSVTGASEDSIGGIRHFPH